MGDQFVGHLQNRLRAAEVLRERDDLGVGEIAFEVEDVVDVGSAPFVNRLIRIAHDAQVGIILRQTAGDGVLGLVRVLIFIDQDVAETGIQLGPQFLVVFQGQGGPEQQIVEVQSVGGPHLLFVDLVDLGHDLAEEIACLAGKFVRSQQLILGLADGAPECFPA